jgi:hypothetical protein
MLAPPGTFEGEGVVDNADPEASYTGTWGTSSWAPGYCGTNYHYHVPGSGTDTFTWTPTLTTAGTYEVFARWCEDPSRAWDATYTIYHDGGSTPAPVDQRTQGGQWVSLGTFDFDGTNDYVELVQSANGYVIADAIKWVNDDGDGTVVAIYAPNVIGEDLDQDQVIDYGFYVNGHKKNCLSCHDASSSHIDHEHRTYESESDNYQAGYRLKSVNGGEPMNIPRPGSDPIANWQDFALCFDCHSRDKLLGENYSDVDQTNFWHDDSSIANSHDFHLSMTGAHVDSDWNGSADSAQSCITCHNVHGSPAQMMIRHGELISSPGTFDKVPALDFVYLGMSSGYGTATWSAPSGDYYVYARWTEDPVRASDAEYTVNYNGGSAPYAVNQKTNGGQWNQLGTGTYSFVSGNSVVLSTPSEWQSGDTTVVADAIGWDSDGVFVDDWDNDGVFDPEIVVDPATSYTPSAWDSSSWAAGYHGDDYQYFYAEPVEVPNAVVYQTSGGRMYMGNSISSNGVCNACHTTMTYFRDPYILVNVAKPQAEPDEVPNSGDEASRTSTVKASVIYHGQGTLDVDIDLSPIGGGIAVMTDEGNGTFSYDVVIPSGTTEDCLDFDITATATDTLDTGNNVATICVDDPAVAVIEVDNTDPEASYTGTWSTSTWAPGYCGTNYHYHEPGSGTDTFTWTPTITTAGTYEVFARWCEDSSRAPDATYTIYDDGGSTPVSVDQRTGGGVWNSLGTFDFDGTDDYVELVQSANGYVIGDAIRLEMQ